MTVSQVDQLKAQGNKAFSAGRFDEAIKFFSDAISLDPTNHVLYSNRSACYASLKKFDKALEDATKTVEIKPEWPKGYGRLAAAHFGLNNYSDARQAYTEGLKIEPTNATFKKGLDDVAKALMTRLNDPFSKVLNDDVWGKIATNPKLSPYLNQSDYAEKMKHLIANPGMVNMYLQDQRILITLITLMGIDLGTREDIPPETSQSPSSEPLNPNPAPSEKNPTPTTEPEPMEVEKSEEEIKREVSLKEKELGNDAYRKRNFETAIQHYDKAWELSEEKEVSILTNKAAVMFEMGKFDQCIELCEKAAEVGRELRADFKLIARAYGRIGNAYLKMENLDEAIRYFNKSLAEHRTPNILQALHETEKLKKQCEKDAYHNPDLANEARDRGNQLFKDQKYPEAIKEYSEAIKRNENDPRGYSNRAATYIKLGAIPEALKDAETAIKIDPKFVKAYIRKANCEFIKKEYSKCLETCETAKSVDETGANKIEIDQQIQKCMIALNTQFGTETGRQEAAKKAMEDPEIQAILTDPVMQQILQQMQSDPGAVRDHMKNPVIASNIRKLIASGVLQTR